MSATTGAQDHHPERDGDDVLGTSLRTWIEDHRRARRLSIRQTAGLAGIDTSTLSRIVRGERTPSIDTIARLARVFKDDPPLRSGTRPFDGPADVIRALTMDPALTDADRRALVTHYLGRRSRRLRVVDGPRALPAEAGGKRSA